MSFRVVPAFILTVALLGCSGSAEPPAELTRAVAAIGYLASPRYINISMYSATAEKGTPSEFISFLFSTMGAAERLEEEDPRDSKGDGGRRGGPPTWPAGVGFKAMKPDPRSGKQVVLVPDDARGKIIAEGYVDPKGKPVVRQEFDMAKPKKKQ
jgi:hypothetical protein